jgi:predicted anti-sigma-YlaC factor YlaD
MSNKNNIFLSCDEANHTCDKTQYNDATLWEKIKLNLHLIRCRACREYTKNNARLTRLMKGKDVKAMPTSEKNCLHQAFEKELLNHR